MRLPRASGVLLHPTSLPGPHGSGDLGAEAFHFVDWLHSAGQRLWQILPLGGIGPGNSPYMSSSAFAGNVLLIDLSELHRSGWLDAHDLTPSPQFVANRVRFPAIVPFRMERLARATQSFLATASAVEHAEFEAFCVSQADWLEDYALFMALVDHHGGQVWSDWAPGLAQRDPKALVAARQQHAQRIAFWKFCQWCFFRQWRRLKAYANERQVRIIGDAPIFIAYQSAEVWANQGLFELDGQGRPTAVAGVPPDYFSATGQRWGNPLYRWSAHAADGFKWWTERIRRTFDLVDIVRIDHFRGFAACWEIAASEPTAINGRWVPAPGHALFQAVSQALGPVPVIAEDLGVITQDVDDLRNAFNFPGMRVLQFAFGEASRNPFLPHRYEPNTVVYTGTHDNDTAIGWWKAASPHERGFAGDYLGSNGKEIHWDLIRAATASVADTAIHTMQDILGLPSTERMNFPGQAEGHWEWRFSWATVLPEHGHRLSHLTRLYGRDGRLATEKD